MDFKALDRARRQAGPLQVDLVESYVRGNISRRGFLKRGAVLGLSLPFMSAIISACGSDNNNSSSGGTTASTSAAGGSAPTGSAAPANIKQGGTLRIVAQ